MRDKCKQLSLKWQAKQEKILPNTLYWSSLAREALVEFTRGKSPIKRFTCTSIDTNHLGRI
jgi:hypothetical protein